MGNTGPSPVISGAQSGSWPIAFQELPLELQAQLEPYFQAALHAELPIRMRWVQMSTAAGASIPQVQLFRDAPAMRGTGAPPPEGPGTFGLTVGLFGGAAAVVALDQGLLDFLIEEGVIPDEARVPALFGSLMLAHQAFYQAGLVQTSPRAALVEMPTFFGFQLLAHGLLDFIGVEADPVATQFTGLVLAAMPYALARQVPALAESLSAASAGRGFQLAGLSKRAAALRVGVAAARVLGWIGIIDLGARGFASLLNNIFHDDQEEQQWRLTRLCVDLLNQDRNGELAAGAFGSFISATDLLRAVVDSEVKDSLRTRIDAIRNDIIAGSAEFGESLEQSLLAMVARHTRVHRGPALVTLTRGTRLPNEEQIAGLKWQTDWAAVRRDIAAFYQDPENQEALENGYELVQDYTGYRPELWATQGLINRIDLSGTIADLPSFQSYLEGRVWHFLLDITEESDAWSRRQGLIRGEGEEAAYIAAGQLSPEQRAALKGEGLELAVRLVYLLSLAEALKTE